MKDIHKNRLLDQARFEIGTDVQLFEFSFDDAIIYNCIIAGICGLFIYLMPQYSVYAGFFYLGAFVMLSLFYLKFGTN